MPKFIVINAADEDIEVDGKAGMTVMEAIRDAGFDELVAACGGCCSCATCHIVVDPDWADKVGAASGDEQDLLDASAKVEATSRLSCQIPLTDALDGMRLRIVEEA